MFGQLWAETAKEFKKQYHVSLTQFVQLPISACIKAYLGNDDLSSVQGPHSGTQFRVYLLHLSLIPIVADSRR
eukprot:gene21646-biopygen7495